jgi:AbrB family looped-hinge helix DNA binding protein
MREITSTVTSKGQVTIPVEIRRHLGLSPSDKVAFVIGKGGKVEVRRSCQPSFFDLMGTLPDLGRETGDFEEIIKEAMDEGVDRMLGLE